MTLVPDPLRQSIRSCLQANRASLLGIQGNPEFETLVRQVYDSVRRVEYFFELRNRTPSPTRSDPAADDFDPNRAAIHHLRARRLDEAAWMVFLSIHFGINRQTRWQLVREVYGALGAASRWDWNRVQRSPKRFTRWLSANHTRLKGGFGNHRKYMSLDPAKRAGTSDAIESYVSWINAHSSHAQLLADFTSHVGADRGRLFDAIYRDMRANVRAFGRTGCFDFLCSLGKLDIFPVEPGIPYIVGATGPRAGSVLLFSGTRSKKYRAKELDQRLRALGIDLAAGGVRFPMQVLEDAICNWQKSPVRYQRFYG